MSPIVGASGLSWLRSSGFSSPSYDPLICVGPFLLLALITRSRRHNESVSYIVGFCRAAEAAGRRTIDPSQKKPNVLLERSGNLTTPFEGPILLVPPPNQLGVLFVANPDEIIADFGIAAEYQRLDVPFDFSRILIVLLKVCSSGGHLKGSEMVLVQRNRRHTENIAVLILNEKIIPAAQPDQFKSGQRCCDAVTVSHRS